MDTDIPVLFRAYNFAGIADEWSLSAKPKLIGNGEQFALPPIHLKKSIVPMGPTEVAVALRLPFRNIRPGKYRLVLHMNEPASGQSAIIETDLELVSK